MVKNQVKSLPPIFGADGKPLELTVSDHFFLCARRDDALRNARFRLDNHLWYSMAEAVSKMGLNPLGLRVVVTDFKLDEPTLDGSLFGMYKSGYTARGTVVQR